MKRPSFQFYPGDWQANSNLRRCTHEEKGIWLDVMCLLHDQEEYGIARWTLKELAQAIGSTVTKLNGLVTKGVLKGADEGHECQALIYTPRSGRKDGDPVTLIERQPGPLWYSSRMVIDEHKRTVRGESGETPKVSPKGGLGATPKASPDAHPSRARPSSSSSSSNHSVPIGTGASAPLDAKDAIFQVAIPWMVERGTPDRGARSLMGAAIKQLGDVEAWRLAQRMMDEKPLEPAAWVAAAINDRINPKGKPNGSDLKHERRKEFLGNLTGDSQTARTFEGTARTVGSGNLQTDEPALRQPVPGSVA